MSASLPQGFLSVVKCSAANGNRNNFNRLPALSNDGRLSLLVALAVQSASQSQRVARDIAKEASKYLTSGNSFTGSDQALMTVPDLETIPYNTVRREDGYEIREVQSYVIAETIMPNGGGFDFFGSSQAFNKLAGYLFGKNAKKTEMEMTTPVVTGTSSEKMDMTTPVLSQPLRDNQWRMAFLMPSKYTEDTLPVPDDPSIKIRRVPARLVAVVAFSGYVTDTDVARREQQLRKAVTYDKHVSVKEFAKIEVAQYNPPFTPPFMRRNEIILEVETKTT